MTPECDYLGVLPFPVLSGLLRLPAETRESELQVTALETGAGVHGSEEPERGEDLVERRVASLQQSGASPRTRTGSPRGSKHPSISEVGIVVRKLIVF